MKDAANAWRLVDDATVLADEWRRANPRRAYPNNLKETLRLADQLAEQLYDLEAPSVQDLLRKIRDLAEIEKALDSNPRRSADRHDRLAGVREDLDEARRQLAGAITARPHFSKKRRVLLAATRGGAR